MEVTPFVTDYWETAEMADEVVGEEMARNERGWVARGRGVGGACPGRGWGRVCLVLKGRRHFLGIHSLISAWPQAFWYFL